MPHHALIFGLQRSGTTVFSKILKQNFGALTQNVKYGPDYWKHRITRPRLPDGVPVFVVFKHPLFWIESVSLRDPRDFYRTHKLTCNPRGEDDNLNGRSILILSTFWANWFAEWVHPHDRSLFMVPYETLLDDYELNEMCRDISIWTGWPRVRDPAVRPKRVTQSPHYHPATDDAYYRGETGLRGMTKKQAKAALKEVERITGRKFWMPSAK